jgi:hypothetical protein
MTAVRWSCAVALVAVMAAAAVQAQEPPKPGPEHEVLKKMEGTWDATMKFGGMESKGTSTYKMDLGGLWLVSTFEGDFGGMKFSGRGLDSYDTAKKKYVGVWVDSMSTSPLILEGGYDAAKKTMTMVGTGPGMGGKHSKYKSVTVRPNDDTIDFLMYVDDGAEPAFTIQYKRRK